MRFAPAVRYCLALVAVLPACTSKAPPATPSTAAPTAPGFAAEIEAFAAWDAKNATPRDPIVFAGSSSIRFWNTAERFPGMPIINRGFGGSQLADVNRYVKETVLRYQPRIVVLYAGDNDINAGKTNDQVLADYETFVRSVHASDSTIDIIFIPIKPSLQRWALWPRMSELNTRVLTHTKAHAHQHYVDLATPMLGADGKPRPELFVEDGLHMTSAGYDGWSAGLKVMLDSLSARQRPESSSKAGVR